MSETDIGQGYKDYSPSPGTAWKGQTRTRISEFVPSPHTTVNRRKKPPMPHDHPSHPATQRAEQTIEDVWESKYAAAGPIWSGRVNKTLEDVVSPLTPGKALDLGCGEGGDTLWLASHGWQATGIDISPTAILRGREQSKELGLDPTSCTFIAEDLATWTPETTYDLVTSSFLHSFDVEIPRTDILRRATELVAKDGYFLLITHAEPPSWADADHHHHGLPSPDEDLAMLNLGERWEILVCETREREGTGPQGQNGTLIDGVIFARRTD